VITKGSWSQYTGFISLIILIIGFLLLVKFILPYVMPFILAIILACLIDPAVDFVEQKIRLSRGVVVFIVLGVLLVIATFLSIIGVARIVRELEELAMSLPKYDNMMKNLIKDFIGRLTEVYIEDPAPVLAVVQDNMDKFYDTLRMAVNTVMGALKFIPTAFVFLIVSFMATYFISRDKDILVDGILRMAPKEWRRKALAMKTEVVRDTMGFIRAQFILAVMTTSIAIIGLSLMGVKFSLTLGLLIGILDFIPTIGPGLIFVPWAIVSFMMGNPTGSFYVVILYVAILLVRQIFQAVMVGENIGVHPLLALMAIYIGIKIFGVVGVIVGPLTAIVLKALIRGIVMPLWQK
jgi:sporulation integral membrane protein YtvI